MNSERVVISARVLIITAFFIVLGKNQKGSDAVRSHNEPMINPIHHAPTQRGSPGLMSTSSVRKEIKRNG